MRQQAEIQELVWRLQAVVKGYKTIFVVTDKVSSEKINYLKALGGEVIVVSNAVEPDHPQYYVNVAKRIQKETPNSIFAYQYSNPANPEIHYKTTGPEIWRQTDGKITHFISSIGTGGTISGTGHYLKEQNPDIKVIGADPLGSIFKHYKETGELIKGTPYLVEGIGQDCLPKNVQFEYIDDIINVSDKESFSFSRLLTREEGIFCGGSTGTIVKVTLDVAENLTENDIIVFVVCDTGERYLSKMHNIEWLKENQMYNSEMRVLRDISDAKKSRGIEDLVYVHNDTKVKDAMQLMNLKGYSQIPVLDEYLKPVGCVKDNRLMKRVVEDGSVMDADVANVMETCFPVLDAKTGIAEVKDALKEHSAVLVTDFGRVTDIITRYDLIDFE